MFSSNYIIQKYGTQLTYELIPIQFLKSHPHYINDITKVCSENEVYSWLFSDLFPNGYRREHAEGFWTFATNGNQQGEHFIFLLRSPDDHIVGCISIKNNNRYAGEVGYWVSHEHKGLATNSVMMLCQIAKNLAFKKLFAQTKLGNERSEMVLTRSGFVRDDSTRSDDQYAKAFVKLL